MKPPYTSTRSRLLLTLLFTSLLLVACTRIGIPEGWSSPVVDGDTLYVGMDGDFRAIGLENGAKIWDFELTGEEDRRAIYGRPAVLDGNVYFGGYDGVLYALTQIDGTKLWGIEVGKDASPLVGGPALADGKVLIGSSDGYLYAFDTENGRLQWSFRTGSRIWSTPVAEDGVVYFGSLDHKVYALNISDGREKWRFDARGGVMAKPLLHDGKVYVGSFASAFYALDAETGAVVWRFDGADSWFWGGAAAGQDVVFAPSLDGKVYALDSQKGTLRWQFDGAAGPIIGTPAGTPAIVPSTSEPASSLGVLHSCNRIRLKRPQLWAVSSEAYWSRTPGQSGDLQIGDYLKIMTPEPNDDGLIQVRVTTHDSRILEGVGDQSQVWIEWGRVEAAGSVDSIFECEGNGTPAEGVASGDEKTRDTTGMPDVSEFRRLAVGSTDGHVWLIDLSDPGRTSSCDIEEPIKASVTAHGDLLLVMDAAENQSLRALAVTPTGMDEKWVHRSNGADGEGKKC